MTSAATGEASTAARMTLTPGRVASVLVSTGMSAPTGPGLAGSAAGEPPLAEATMTAREVAMNSALPTPRRRCYTWVYALISAAIAGCRRILSR